LNDEIAFLFMQKKIVLLLSGIMSVQALVASCPQVHLPQ
jgi:hypothetical protein